MIGGSDLLGSSALLAAEVFGLGFRVLGFMSKGSGC